MASCDASPRQRCKAPWSSTGSNVRRSPRARRPLRRQPMLSRRPPASPLPPPPPKTVLPRGVRSPPGPWGSMEPRRRLKQRWPLLVMRQLLLRLRLLRPSQPAPRLAPCLTPLPPALAPQPRPPRPRPSAPSIKRPLTGLARPMPASRPSRRRPGRRLSPVRPALPSNRQSQPSRSRLLLNQPLLIRNRIQPNQRLLQPRRLPLSQRFSPNQPLRLR